MADRRYEAESIIDDDSETVFYNGREFAICEFCMWTATTFKTKHGHRLLDICPMCSSGEYLSFIPLSLDERYRFTIDEKRGLEIQFWTGNSG
jgi:hypothetical protein